MLEPVKVTGCPHPFRAARVSDLVPHGATLAEIVERGLDGLKVPQSLRGHGHAFVGDRYVPREEWSSTVPAPGAAVTYRIVPHGGGGGGGKNPLRTILTIVVIAVAMWASAGVAGMGIFAQGGALAGWGSVAGAVAGAAVTAVGMLAVNAIAPIRTSGPSLPSYGSQKDSNAYSITGSRNVISPFGPVPVVLGRHRHTPPQGGLPVTELFGNDQYVRQLFVLGYSGLVIDGEYKIGESPTSAYRDVEIERIAAATSGTRPRYYTNDSLETAVGVQLTAASGWQTRRTAQECDSFSFDVACPRGLVQFDDRGKKITRTVTLEAKWQRVGETAWRSIGGQNHGIAARTFELDWEPGIVWWTIYVSANGMLTCTKGQRGHDFPPGVPGGAYGVAQIRANRLVITSVIPLRSPSTSTGLALSSVSGGVENGAFRPPRVTVGEGTCNLTSLVISAKTTTPIRRTIGADSGQRGYIDIMVRRVTADNFDSQISDESWWANMRAVKDVPPLNFAKPLDVVSMRIKATGQLNGAVDEFNLVPWSAALDWDSTAGEWVHRETSNPASLFRHVLQHPANARPVPDSKIDLEQLQHWHEFCAAKGFEYNKIHDYVDSVFDVCRDIASSGLAGIARPDGKWSVVIDEPKTEEVQHFTPRNSWGFRARKRLARLPHAWRVKFVNAAKSWLADERIVYADGYDESTATLFEGVEFPGVTNAEQVWKLARHHYAVAKQRPEDYELYADMEHLVCTRGDLVRCSHSVILVGLSQGRVKFVDAPEVLVTVDEPCQMIEGKAYGLRWRDSVTGQSQVRDVILDVGEQTELMLDGAGPLPAKGDLFMFGERGLESGEYLVADIQDAGNFSARMILKDYSPAIFDAASGVVPPFDSKITLPYPPAVMRVPVPEIVAVRSDESVLAGVPGAFTPRIEVSFRAVSCDMVAARVRQIDGEWRAAGQSPADNGVVYISDVDEGEEYEISLRSVNSSFSVASQWSVAIAHTVVGRTTPPPAPDAIYLSGQGIIWTMPSETPLDVVGWEVLIGATGASVAQAVSISDGLVTQRRFDLSKWAGIIGLVWVRTVDDAGLRSTAVSVAINLGDAPVANVVESISEAARPWTGTITNGQIYKGAITTVAMDPLWSDEQMWGSEAMWATPYGVMVYVGSHVVTADQAGTRMSIQVDVTQGQISTVEYARGPEGAWFQMEAFILAGGEGELLKVKVTTQSGQRAVIEDILWIFDVPDAESSVDSFDVPAGGARLPVPEHYFRWISTVMFGLEYVSGGTAVSVRWVDKGVIADGVVTQGPLVECIDSTGTSVAGRIDARIQGAAIGG